MCFVKMCGLVLCCDKPCCVLRLRFVILQFCSVSWPTIYTFTLYILNCMLFIMWLRIEYTYINGLTAISAYCSRKNVSNQDLRSPYV